MTQDEVKKKIEEMYELMGLDVDDITEEEMGRLMSFYIKNQSKLEEDLLNIKNKSVSKKGN
jgi:hypothetical protein